jgi:ATP-dependent DNA helicase DinG
LRYVVVGDLIREHIYAHKESIVYTAATLRHNDKFNSFRSIVGLEEPLEFRIDRGADLSYGPNGAGAEGEIETAPQDVAVKTLAVRTMAIPSPFKKENRQIQVHERALNGRFDNKSAWLERVVALLPTLIGENHGRTLVLFSSYRDLLDVAAKIAPQIESQYPLLIQRPGSSTINLCDEFRAVKESVLLGVDTFWYGVDFKGDTLTQVVITRIPYPNPRDPIQAARKEIFPPRAYWSRYHYDTHIKMQQGIGRLIRSESDKGRVVILDSRYKVS